MNDLLPLPEWVLLNAVRYALGRMSYVVGATVDELVRAWPNLSDETRTIIARDVEEAFEADERGRRRGDLPLLGMEQDRCQWERARTLWRGR